MNSKIEKIVVVYENCEATTLRSDDIAYISLWSKHGHFSFDAWEMWLWDNYCLSLTVDLDVLPKSEANDIENRKDITHVLVYPKDCKDYLTFQIVSPGYTNSWLPNPYQDNEIYTDEGSGHKMLSIYVHPYWSLLSIRMGICDSVGFFFRHFPQTLLWDLERFWINIKKHFKWRH